MGYCQCHDSIVHEVITDIFQLYLIYLSSLMIALHVNKINQEIIVKQYPQLHVDQERHIPLGITIKSAKPTKYNETTSSWSTESNFHRARGPG